jgi:hypothetical protein
MKNSLTIFVLSLLVSLVMLACGGSENSLPELPEEPEAPAYPDIQAIVSPSASFAPDDGSSALSGSSAQNVAKLLAHTGPSVVKGMGEMQIADAEYQEIKAFTDQLVDGIAKPMEVYQTIFRWIVNNISYQAGFVDNNPYPVFKTHKAVCQGYANLLNVMLHSQGIPALNANGMLTPLGGHAWNYVYLDEWYVSDPTNAGHFRMDEPDTYQHLVPLMIDADLFEDEHFVYRFYEEHLSIRRVKKSGRQLIVPFGTNGFQVSAFNPSEPLPDGVEEVYIGRNILSLGEHFLGLGAYAPSVKHAFVDSANPRLVGYGQVVYRDNWPYYVPACATVIQFQPIATLGKNFIKDHAHLETVVIQSGTKKMEAYAFENCPNLRMAIIPEETLVDARAFDGVHPEFKIFTRK